jgi:hypothetical protein
MGDAKQIILERIRSAGRGAVFAPKGFLMSAHAKLLTRFLPISLDRSSVAPVWPTTG